MPPPASPSATGSAGITGAAAAAAAGASSAAAAVVEAAPPAAAEDDEETWLDAIEQWPADTEEQQMAADVDQQSTPAAAFTDDELRRAQSVAADLRLCDYTEAEIALAVGVSAHLTICNSRLVSRLLHVLRFYWAGKQVAATCATVLPVLPSYGKWPCRS